MLARSAFSRQRLPHRHPPRLSCVLAPAHLLQTRAGRAAWRPMLTAGCSCCRTPTCWDSTPLCSPFSSTCASCSRWGAVHPCSLPACQPTSPPPAPPPPRAALAAQHSLSLAHDVHVLCTSPPTQPAPPAVVKGASPGRLTLSAPHKQTAHTSHPAPAPHTPHIPCRRRRIPQSTSSVRS